MPLSTPRVSVRSPGEPWAASDPRDRLAVHDDPGQTALPAAAPGGERRLMTDLERLLRERLAEAGVTGVTSVEPASGGFAAVGGLAPLADGTGVFVKTLQATTRDDVFRAEAEGLQALRANGVPTPDVVAATSGALVL